MSAQGQEHIRLQTGFYPDWYHKNYGIVAYGKECFFNADKRIEARMAMDRVLHERFGDVGLVGDINTTGIQNLALKIRGDQLYIDYFENPDLCHHLLRICTESIKQLFDFNYKATGTGAVTSHPCATPSSPAFRTARRSRSRTTPTRSSC